METGNWKLETGKPKLELENGDWILETGRPKLDGCGCMVLKSEISNLKFPLGVSTTQGGAAWAVFPSGCQPPKVARLGRFSPRGVNPPKWHGLGGV